ncbi:MAG TPA: sigma 54-interacting transcriptional regulator [Firmicutes bacterium]|nr:sigma 54-interacting transcriptional regulator [Bacillota bacterium]
MSGSPNFESVLALLNSLGLAVLACDAAGHILLASDAAAKLFNAMPRDLLGRNVGELIPPDSCSDFPGASRTVNGRSIRVRRRDLELESTMLALFTLEDVTETIDLVRQLDEMRSMKSTLETILENAYEGIVVVDADGFITMLNQPYARFLGVDAETAVGKHVTDVIENTRLHLVVQTGIAEVGEVQRIRGHNTVVMRVPIFKDGRVIGAVGKVMFRDVQEARALVRRLNVLEEKLELYKRELKRAYASKYSLQSIVGESQQIKDVKRMIEKVARTNSTVLIRGESGTGKELVAHAIHELSAYHGGPFVKINCAAVPETLLESELFGYVEGAFTGARNGGKPGKFELADGGTIFLDEIGDMPGNMQAKLLRVLQEREIERIGSNRPTKVNVRVIAATNQNLEQKVRSGEFRADLYFRLNVVTITLPPLREHREDIPLLLNHLINRFNSEFGIQVKGVSAEALSALMAYSWPGNVRELENMLERAYNLIEQGDVVSLEHLPDHLRRKRQPEQAARRLQATLQESERAAIIAALKATGGNRTETARLLGIHRSGLYQKLKKYHIEPSSVLDVSSRGDVAEHRQSELGLI